MPDSVALLAEGVDRNMFVPLQRMIDAKSPSSRRAWIEIALAVSDDDLDRVALLAEGVDRNTNTIK